MAALDFIQKYNPFTGVGAGLEQHFQNLGDIKANAPSQKAYNIEATRDLWSNVSENVTNPITRGIIDYTAPALSLVTSPIYDATQAGIRTLYDTNTGEFRGPLDNFDITNTMNPDYKGNPTPGFLTRLDQENPLSSAVERFIGAGGNLYDRWSDDDDETGTIAFDPNNPQFNKAGLGVMSLLKSKFGPKIAAYLKNRALTKIGKTVGPKIRKTGRDIFNPPKTPTPPHGGGWHPGVGGNGGTGSPGGGGQAAADAAGGAAYSSPFNRGGLAWLR